MRLRLWWKRVHCRFPERIEDDKLAYLQRTWAENVWWRFYYAFQRLTLFVKVRTSVCFRVTIGLKDYSREIWFFHIASEKSDKFDGISFSLMQRGKSLNLLSPKISIARVKVKPVLIFRQSATRDLASFTTHIFESWLAPIACVLKEIRFALSVTTTTRTTTKLYSIFNT